MQSPDSPVHRYHDGTKHYFNRFSRSLGYLDWASQPRPFRSYEGAPVQALYPTPGADSDVYVPGPRSYDSVFGSPRHPQPLTVAAIGDLLRHALGLSAWKQAGTSRWSLRVNPSSGNLHPTEAYVVCGPLVGLSEQAGVYHYAVEQHALERRCALDPRDWAEVAGGSNLVVVVFSSIHWRESWKYGERAFRYCQHDLGHALGAVALSAAMLGWRVVPLPSCGHRDVAALVGLDRDEDFVDAEREEPGCALALVAGTAPAAIAQGGASLARLVRRGEWFGRASQLSQDHVQWTFIDDIARATADTGPSVPSAAQAAPAAQGTPPALSREDFRTVALRRRSAVAFDASSSLPADTWFAMLARALPGPGAPWSALWWTPRIHLVLFVHRVDGVRPGLYLLSREPAAGGRLRDAMRADLLREAAHATLPLMCLSAGDCRALARRVSCDQDIASDGCFSLAMVAEFDASLREHGPSFYRNLYWEAGVIGQVLYLEAEAAGFRATGIGCYYDDAVHEVLGLEGHAFQSLYHFTVGVPVEDARLTTEPGYRWEGQARSNP